MSDGEIVLSIAGVLLTFVAWGVYYARFVTRPIGHGIPGKAVMRLAPLSVGLLIFAVLRTVASYDVVNDPRYIFQYLFVGLAWTGLAAGNFAYMGISVRDDIVERANPAVVPAFVGGMLGVACCYSGGNIGDGPGWWVVIFAALIATAGLWILWTLLERFTHISDVITIDRDIAAGNRLGGFLFGNGLILGRAVAGDWVSAAATISDFAQIAWPCVPLLVLAIVIERSAQPTPERPEPAVTTLGLTPAFAYTAIGAAHVAWLGMPQ